MKKTDVCYSAFLQILREELVPAMGCTEPIAVAYAAAKARQVLGALPERMEVAVSGNIIKNVKRVVVPTTLGMKGIAAAAAAGAARGDAEAELEVLAHLTAEDAAAVGAYLEKTSIEVRHADTPHIFDIDLTAYAGEDSAEVRITDYHTNLVLIRRCGETLLEKQQTAAGEETLTDRSCLSVERIVPLPTAWRSRTCGRSSRVRSNTTWPLRRKG